jgi:hypothetical protein
MLQRAIRLVDVVGRAGRVIAAVGAVLTVAASVAARYLDDNDVVDEDEFDWYDPESGDPVASKRSTVQ